MCKINKTNKSKFTNDEELLKRCRDHANPVTNAELGLRPASPNGTIIFTEGYGNFLNRKDKS